MFRYTRLSITLLPSTSRFSKATNSCSHIQFRALSDHSWHGTTIICVRKDGKVVMGGDGQVSMGSTVVKGRARKVRKLKGDILVGFAGSTADALTLVERLERKLDEYPGQLTRACVDMAKAWRSDKYLRRLEVGTINISLNAISEF
jgi:ATP-dependent protease HslVU peptidase subunit